MKILLEKLQKLGELEDASNKAEEAYTNEPENEELENDFDVAYKAEYEAYINAAKYIEYITGGEIDFKTAKKIIKTKRSELLSVLSA